MTRCFSGPQEVCALRPASSPACIHSSRPGITFVSSLLCSQLIHWCLPASVCERTNFRQDGEKGVRRQQACCALEIHRVSAHYTKYWEAELGGSLHRQGPLSLGNAIYYTTNPVAPLDTTHMLKGLWRCVCLSEKLQLLFWKLISFQR